MHVAGCCGSPPVRHDFMIPLIVSIFIITHPLRRRTDKKSGGSTTAIASYGAGGGYLTIVKPSIENRNCSLLQNKQFHVNLYYYVWMLMVLYGY